MLTFKGVQASTYGTVLSLPPFKRAEKQVVYHKVEGSDKTEREDLGFRPYDLPCSILLHDNTDLDDFIAWLEGEGQLIRNEDDDKFVYAYIDREVQFDRYSRGVNLKVASFDFTILDPFRYALDEDDTILTVAGTVTNQGTYHSEPIMIIEGSGEVVIDIDGRTFTYDFLTDSEVVIDSQQKEAYFATSLKNRQMTGNFPYLTSGVNNISWTGTVTSITIQPNSRWL